MPCPCMQNKKKTPMGSNSADSCTVRIINHSPTPAPILGKSSQQNYGNFKNGDRIKIRVEDYNAEPEKYVRL